MVIRVARFVAVVLIMALLFDACNKESPTPAPAITGIQPATAGTGTLITITGTNFSPTLAGNKVQFNSIDAGVKEATATQIKAIVPSGDTNGPIAVTVGEQKATSIDNFKLLCLPLTYVAGAQKSSYEYNSLNQVIRFVLTLGPNSATVSFNYNSDGSASTRKVVVGSATVSTSTYSYDINRRMISETTDGSTTTYSYNSSGQLILATYSALENSAFTYPNNTTHNFSRETYTSLGNVSTYDYEYDNQANVFKILYPWLPFETDNNSIKSTYNSTTVSNYALTYNMFGLVTDVVGSGAAASVNIKFTYSCY